MWIKFAGQLFNMSQYDRISADIEPTCNYNDTYRLALIRGKSTKDFVVGNLTLEQARLLIEEIHAALSDGLKCYDVTFFCFHNAPHASSCPI